MPDSTDAMTNRILASADANTLQSGDRVETLKGCLGVPKGRKGYVGRLVDDGAAAVVFLDKAIDTPSTTIPVKYLKRIGSGDE